MSTTTSFGFTNVSPVTTSIAAPVAVKPITNYGKIEDEADLAAYSNKTCLGQREIISYGAKTLPNLNLSKDMKWINKPTNMSVSQYVVKIEDLLRTTGTDGTIIQDDGISAYLVVKHNDSPYITPEHLQTVVNRLYGCLQTDNGISRFADLMAGSLTITQD